MTVGLARRRGIDPRVVGQVWQSIREGEFDGDRACPHCRRSMRQAEVEDPLGQQVTLDGCVTCHCLWFDKDELERMPATPQAAPKPLPREARELLAKVEVDRIRQEAEAEAEADSGHSLAAWQWVPAIFGLPVELKQPAMTRTPVVTWGVAALCALTLLLTWAKLDAAVAGWGLVPAEWSRHGGLTLITSFFLHAGLVHLLGNAYFLLVFGDNVEDLLGHGGFACLLGGSALAGSLLHGILEPQGQLPLVGASGGVYGVLAFYALSFPRARVGFVWYFRVFSAPVWAMFLLYVVLQGFGAWMQVSGGNGGVSALAHLGGAAVGAVAALVARRGSRPQRGLG